jgi:V/A-type H+-transporting ATPase subunit K
MLLPETLIIFGLAVSLILMFAWTPFNALIAAP